MSGINASFPSTLATDGDETQSSANCAQILRANHEDNATTTTASLDVMLGRAYFLTDIKVYNTLDGSKKSKMYGATVSARHGLYGPEKSCGTIGNETAASEEGDEIYNLSLCRACGHDQDWAAQAPVAVTVSICAN